MHRVRPQPTFQKGASGRDHNPFGFTAWLAGAGVNAPFTYGATDEFGWKAGKDALTLHDFHATILHLLGLDHEPYPTTTVSNGASLTCTVTCQEVIA